MTTRLTTNAHFKCGRYEYEILSFSVVKHDKKYWPDLFRPPYIEVVVDVLLRSYSPRPSRGEKVTLTWGENKVVWEFPQDRFIEYEPKDEWWCRKYGFGREVVKAVENVVEGVIQRVDVPRPNSDLLTAQIQFEARGVNQVDSARIYPRSPMKVEAVVVCTDYSDFLSWTLPTNKQHFNKMVVVTSSADVKTQKLCEFWHVQCVVTDVCYDQNAPFNKGKMINAGLRTLDGDGWVVHMDADIFLPPLFRKTVEKLDLDLDGLYTMDRMMCEDFVEWLRYYTQPVLSNEADVYVHLRPFPLGVRIAKSDNGGWLPIGYFQMWNQGKLRLTYPTEHTDAGRSDMLFARKFPRNHRHMLGELVCIHLATGKGMGANWNGRKTPVFGGDILSPTEDNPEND